MASRPTATRLPRNRIISIRDGLAALMRAAEPTPFALEGPCRHGVRVALIYDGWAWGAADAAAALIVEAALALAGAKRPTWREGQPEWTQDGAAPIQRETCKRCAKPLPEDRRLYCSEVCAKAAHIDLHRRRDKEEKDAWTAAYRAAWSARQPARECPACGRAFKPKRPEQKYCCRACSQFALRMDRRGLSSMFHPL